MRRALLLVVVALVAAPSARADGDPASDVLYTQWVFAPLGTSLTSPEVKRLQALVDELRAKKYPVKVAIIGSRLDLGSVGVLWRFPQRYAEFLGKELAFIYRGRLLTVMPNGFGYYDIGKAKPIPAPALARLPVGRGGIAMANAATRALAAVARQEGRSVPVPALRRGNKNADRIRLALIGAGVLLLLGVAELVARRRRRLAVPHEHPRS